MSNQIAVVENNLKIVAPHLEQVLQAYKMPVERLMRTVLVSLERLPALQECPTASVLNAAMTAACLGLEVDGVTGQGFLIPFGGKAQFITGYKGYNTMAARSGYTLGGSVVREGDDFDYQIGTGGFVHHRPALGNEAGRKVIASYAKAEMPGRSPIIQVISLDQLLEIKSKSPGAKKKDSPWNQPGNGFDAMATKTAKRRLARDMPLNSTFHMAASMEDQLDLGRPTHITPDKGLVIDVQPSTEPTHAKTYKRDKFEILFTSMGKPPAVREDVNSYKSQVVQILDRGTSEQLRQFKRDNKAYIEKLVIEEKYGELAGLLDRLNAIEDIQ